MRICSGCVSTASDVPPWMGKQNLPIPWMLGLAMWFVWSMECWQSYIPSTVCVCVCVCVSSAPRPLEASDLHQEKNTNLSLNHRMSPVEQTHSLEPIPADLQTHECILGVVYAELRAAFSCSIIATKADHSGGTDGEKLL